MSYYFVPSTDANVLKDIKIALSQGRCIFVVGSDLSTPAFLEDGNYQRNWQGLLQKITDKAREKDWFDEETTTEIRALIHAGFLSEAGQEIEDRLRAKQQLQICLKEALSSDKVKASELHLLIAKISFRACLTTNYDMLIENAYFNVKEPQRLEPYYEDTIEQALAAFRDNQPLILKLHGGIERPDTITLSDRNFERRFHRASNYWRDMEKLLAIPSVLFIGFDKEESRELIGFLNRIDAFNALNKHWLVIPEAQLPDLLAKRLHEKMGIHIIQYKDDSTHSELIAFLRELSTSFSAARLSSEQGERINRVSVIPEIQPKAQQALAHNKPSTSEDSIIPQKTITIFVSYAEGDEMYRGALEKQLKFMRRQFQIEVRDASQIKGGEVTEDEIKKYLSTAEIILLLISIDLLSDTFIFESQIEQAIERHMEGKAHVIPILLRAVDDWENTSLGKFKLGSLQPLPKNRKFMTSYKDDDAFAEVAKGIREVVNGLLAKS